MRQEKVLTVAKQNKVINGTDTVWERIPQETNVHLKSYLQLNNKYTSREMKANGCEQRAKVNKKKLVKGKSYLLNWRNKIQNSNTEYDRKSSPFKWKVLSHLLVPLF